MHRPNKPTYDRVFAEPAEKLRFATPACDPRSWRRRSAHGIMCCQAWQPKPHCEHASGWQRPSSLRFFALILNFEFPENNRTSPPLARAHWPTVQSIERRKAPKHDYLDLHELSTKVRTSCTCRGRSCLCFNESYSIDRPKTVRTCSERRLVTMGATFSQLLQQCCKKALEGSAAGRALAPTDLFKILVQCQWISSHNV